MGGDEIFVSRLTQTIVKSLSFLQLGFQFADDKHMNTVCASSWQRDVGNISCGHLGLFQQLQLLSKAHIQGPPSSLAGWSLNAKGTFCC